MYILISMVAVLFLAIIIGDRLFKGETRQEARVDDPWATYSRPAYLRRRR